MRHIIKKLEDKGWEKEHIDEAMKIFFKAQANKHPHIHFLEHSVYWFSLLVAIAGNFIIAIALIPLLLTLNSLPLYLIVITIGISFGLLFELLIRTIYHLDDKHHLLLSLLIPSIALLTVVAIVIYTNQLDIDLGLQNVHSPLAIACVYVIAFMLPYLVVQIFLKKK